MSRAFRFAVTVDGTSRDHLIEMVRRAEGHGFDVIAGVDHVGPPAGVLPMLAAVTQLSPLRVSPMVIANDHRHPVLLAKDAATIDVLSNGRFELGIGSGWIEDHYRALGTSLDPGGIRVERLEEALQIIRGCWSGSPFQHAGRHYQVDVTGSPPPVQQPGPPLLVAGAGPRMLAVAARHADIVGITLTQGHRGFDTFVPAIARSGEHIHDQLRWLRRAAGDRFESLELNVMVHLALPSEARVEAFASESGVEPAQLETSPHILLGPVGKMVETLQQRRDEWGLSYVVVRGPDLALLGPVVERLAGT